MDIDTIMDQLRRTPAGSRKLDSNIAFALGWRHQVAKISTTDGDQKRNMWFRPNSNEIVAVPFWTTSHTDSYNLANELAPRQQCGMSWENGKGSAKIGNGPYFEAANGPIALCLAVLNHVKGKT